MKIIFVTILVVCAIETFGYSRTDRRIFNDKRQATNADQMVQNILQWLEGSYVQNSRKIRQGTLREYLPPNTEKPRPFQPGYPPAGYSPQPAFPIPTNPATGAVTAPEGYAVEGNEILQPPNEESGPVEGSGTGENGYQPALESVKPEFTLPTTTAGASTTGIPGRTLPAEQTTISNEYPVNPTEKAVTTAYPEAPQSTYFTIQTSISTLLPENTQYPSLPSFPTSSEVSTTQEAAAAVTTTTVQSQKETIPTTSRNPSIEEITEPQPSDNPTQEAAETNPQSADTISSEDNESVPNETTLSSVISTIGPDLSTSLPDGDSKSILTSDEEDEDLKHPPHIHAIDVECSKDMMTINIEFNREFNGVIYSKEHYSNPDCRYVQENSASTNYSFTVSLDKCGTQFVNAFDTQNQSYLENVLVLQNEAGIQEVWDTIRSVRCLWEGNLKDTLSVAFSIGMLSQEIITFSGDTAMAKLDVLLGRGPFGEPANGLVKIGEQMTLVISVSGDPGFDLQVKECKALDVDAKNTISLTDEDGCILKPKLFGAFQKTRETGSTGASIIAYAYFNAFKFPDEMDLMIECNIELCKTDCEICTKENQQLEPSAKRRRRNVIDNNNSTALGDFVTMGKLVRVILPQDLNKKVALEIIEARDHICMTIHNFVFSTALLTTLLIITSFISVCLWIRRKEKLPLKY